jgi:hypothetical protein
VQRGTDGSVLSEVYDLDVIGEIFGSGLDDWLHAAGAGAWHALIKWLCPKTVRVWRFIPKHFAAFGNNPKRVFCIQNYTKITPISYRNLSALSVSTSTSLALRNKLHA